MTRLWISALVVAAWLLPGAVASANPWEVYGLGARALGMGGAAVSQAEGYSATYYNPALLTWADRLHVGVDLHASQASLQITAPQARGSYQPQQAQGRAGLSLGLATPLWEGSSLSLGWAAHVPYGDALSVRLLDPQVPQWYRYDTLPQKLQAAAGLGWRPLPWLGLGLGAQYMGAIDGEAQIDANLTEGTLPRRDLRVRLQSALSPTAGLWVEPGGGLRLAASWRGALGLDYALPLLVNLGEGAQFVIGASGVSLYVPQDWSLGASADLRQSLGWPLRLALDLVWSRWSQAPSPGADLYIDTGGDLAEALGVEGELDFSVPPEAPPGFVDTLTWRAGLEAQPWEAWRLRAGVAWRPSALEGPRPQVGYIDADAWIGALGLGWQPDEAGLWGLDLGGQCAWLGERRRGSASAEDPVGAYRARGQIWTLVLGARHRWPGP